jgi:glycosyltransferase involved in cell wall biosynthesis
VRIALLTYRGNMYCGGQGIYAAHLAREWHRLGHEVHVIAGPPLPALDPEIPLHVIPNQNVFGVPHPDWARRADPLRLLEPLSLWELGVSRIGVFPEMQTFGLRLLLRWRELQARHRFDVVFDNQCLSWGLLGIQATGVPVVSVIHHPLHIDRAADYAIDPSFRMRVKRTLYFPMLMQQIVARRLARIVTVSEASRAEIERCFGIPE